MKPNDYLMEDEEEAFRLDQKTDPLVVERQALWAGIQPGMRVADLGCGSGKTTSVLSKLVQPGGEALGMDFSPSRYEFAISRYGAPGVQFICRDVRDPLDDLGLFDFVWVRFLLEYYLVDTLDMVKNMISLLKPGGILCLIDLDHNCLNHYGLSKNLEKTLQDLATLVQAKGNFDPWAGRKLYSFLYDLRFEQISVDVEAHHLIYGDLQATDCLNWLKKVQVAPQKIGYDFQYYAGSSEEFLRDCNVYLKDPRRFIYTPIISCRGVKPTD
jgi:SAM-dependent methyltransferase